MSELPRLLFRDVEVDGRLTSVLVEGRHITGVGQEVASSGADFVIDGGGGALIPGLHDHHVHLMATAARDRSVDVGPPAVGSVAELAGALRSEVRTGPYRRWVRAVGYHESVAGDLDRWALDALVDDRPVRVQHRSGARWTVNSAGATLLGLKEDHNPGVERDATGAVTGRLHRMDDRLRDRWREDGDLSLARLGERLASLGVTGVTDATPYDSMSDMAPLVEAVRSGSLPVHVTTTGSINLVDAEWPAELWRGPVKIVIDDATYPSLDSLVASIRRSHLAGRTVAVHCVTRTALVLALAAWEEVGAADGDRIEHGAVIPPGEITSIRRLGLRVVTQPGFVAERGDQYLAEVEAEDLAHLYRCRSLLRMGVRVAGSTDMPFTDPDPWRAIDAACRRVSPNGRVLGAEEVVDPGTALALFARHAVDPGGSTRTVSVGGSADLCLLSLPRHRALVSPAASNVRATVRQGDIVFADRTAGAAHRR